MSIYSTILNLHWIGFLVEHVNKLVEGNVMLVGLRSEPLAPAIAITIYSEYIDQDAGRLKVFTVMVIQSSSR